MPIQISENAGATAYSCPIIGPFTTVNQLIDVSTLGTDEVDEYGYLKPGVPFYVDGDLVAAGEYVYGVTPYAVKLTADDNTTLASDPDVHVALAVNCTLNRDIAEDNLGRAYSADELAAFVAAGSSVRVTPT
jgi:hypothetical protein